MSSSNSRLTRYGINFPLIGLALSLITPTSSVADEPGRWTLQTSVQQVLEVAPEMRAAESAVSAREGAWQQAGVWPNPEIELRTDDKVGKDAGDNGYDLTQISLSQPLPLSGQRVHRRDIMAAELAGARAERRYERLLLEAETARRFHTLQFTTAQLQLAEQRLQFADELQRVGVRRQQAGELARLEGLRLDLIREAAQQASANAEGKFSEALSHFRAYLALPADALPTLSPLEPFGSLPSLATLQTELPEHPALTVGQTRLKAARAGVELARSQRLPDPVLRLFRDRDFLNGRRQTVTGIGVAVTVPLWDRNAGRIGEARAQSELTQADIQALQRDLDSRLRQNHLHLSHLVEQAEHYRTRVFAPAQTLFELTGKAYAAGEAEILSLIDANNTYFDAQVRYLELLQDAWLEAAELRLAAGRTLITLEQELTP